MEIKGKIIQKLEPQSGTSKAGNAWKKQEYVLETLDSYPRKVKFDFFGDRADQYVFEVGDVITLSYDIESREFNGRWYTDIRGFKAVKEDPNMASAPAPYPAEAVGPAPAPAPDAGMAAPAPPVDNTFDQPGGSDDLPF
ncbi:MAG: DUF3127 domain-containing protein [Muribaculaceae bacterium]|nr:DUF3127 domain-containing protein [Muribaculaceae bacterium]MBQ7205021.1 DUF3127 domain-containing protein [Muribaculaceae bacterium]